MKRLKWSAWALGAWLVVGPTSSAFAVTTGETEGETDVGSSSESGDGSGDSSGSEDSGSTGTGGSESSSGGEDESDTNCAIPITTGECTDPSGDPTFSESSG